MTPAMTQTEQDAYDALEACGATLTREQFGIYLWTWAEREQAAWDAYRTITSRPQ
jgi:hypothetical protein